MATREIMYLPSNRVNYIDLPLNQANYVAISVLEKLGLDAPSQKQIDLIETLVQLAMRMRAPTRRSNKHARKFRRSRT